MCKFLDTTGLTRLWEHIVSKLGGKQDKLVSGTNIKTINGNSLLGSGDIEIQGGGDKVTSVNGKIGEVVLTASDVGAVSSVNTKTGDVTITPDDIGAVALSDFDQTTTDLSTQIDSKVSYISTEGRLYVTGQSVESIPFSNGVLASSIVQRGSDGSITVAETPSSDNHATSKKYVDSRSLVEVPIKRVPPGTSAFELVNPEDLTKLTDLFANPRCVVLVLTDGSDIYTYYVTDIDTYAVYIYFTSYDEGYNLQRLRFHPIDTDQYLLTALNGYIPSESAVIRRKINAKSNSNGYLLTQFSNLTTLDSEKSATVDTTQYKNIYVEVIPKTGSALIGTTIPVSALSTTYKRYQLTDEVNYVSFSMKISSVDFNSATLSITLSTHSQGTGGIVQVIALP